MDEEQIGDGINPSSGQRGLIDLRATFQVDEFGAKEKLSKIKRRNGNFRPSRKEDVRSLLQKYEKDLYQSHNKGKGAPHNIHQVVRIFSIHSSLFFISHQKNRIAFKGFPQLKHFYKMAPRRTKKSYLLDFLHRFSKLDLTKTKQVYDKFQPMIK